jgi:hypothetical protein
MKRVLLTCTALAALGLALAASRDSATRMTVAVDDERRTLASDLGLEDIVNIDDRRDRGDHGIKPHDLSAIKRYQDCMAFNTTSTMDKIVC